MIASSYPHPHSSHTLFLLCRTLFSPSLARRTLLALSIDGCHPRYYLCCDCMRECYSIHVYILALKPKCLGLLLLMPPQLWLFLPTVVRALKKHDPEQTRKSNEWNTERWLHQKWNETKKKSHNYRGEGNVIIGSICILFYRSPINSFVMSSTRFRSIFVRVENIIIQNVYKVDSVNGSTPCIVWREKLRKYQHKLLTKFTFYKMQ